MVAFVAAVVLVVGVLLIVLWQVGVIVGGNGNNTLKPAFFDTTSEAQVADTVYGVSGMVAVMGTPWVYLLYAPQGIVHHWDSSMRDLHVFTQLLVRDGLTPAQLFVAYKGRRLAVTTTHVNPTASFTACIDFYTIDPSTGLLAYYVTSYASPSPAAQYLSFTDDGRTTSFATYNGNGTAGLLVGGLINPGGTQSLSYTPDVSVSIALVDEDAYLLVGLTSDSLPPILPQSSNITQGSIQHLTYSYSSPAVQLNTVSLAPTVQLSTRSQLIFFTTDDQTSQLYDFYYLYLIGRGDFVRYAVSDGTLSLSTEAASIPASSQCFPAVASNGVAFNMLNGSTVVQYDAVTGLFVSTSITPFPSVSSDDVICGLVVLQESTSLVFYRADLPVLMIWPLMSDSSAASSVTMEFTNVSTAFSFGSITFQAALCAVAAPASSVFVVYRGAWTAQAFSMDPLTGTLKQNYSLAMLMNAMGDDVVCTATAGGVLYVGLTSYGQLDVFNVSLGLLLAPPTFTPDDPVQGVVDNGVVAVVLHQSSIHVYNPAPAVESNLVAVVNLTEPALSVATSAQYFYVLFAGGTVVQYASSSGAVVSISALTQSLLSDNSRVYITSNGRLIVAGLGTLETLGGGSALALAAVSSQCVPAFDSTSDTVYNVVNGTTLLQYTQGMLLTSNISVVPPISPSSPCSLSAGPFPSTVLLARGDQSFVTTYRFA